MLRSIDTSSCDSTAASTTAFKENSVIRYAEFSDLSADDDDDADEEEEEYDDGDSTFAPGRSTTSSAASKRGKKRKKTGNSKSNKAIKAAGKNQARKGVAKGSVEGVDQGGGNVNKPPRSIAMVGRRGRIATKAAFATNINMTPPQQQQQQQRLLPDSPSIATSRQQPNNLVGQYPWIMAHQLALLQQHHLKQFQLMHDFVAAQHRNQRYRQTISSSSSSSRCSTHHHPLLNNIRTKPSSPSLLEKIHHHHSATARLELKYLFACFDYDGRELEDGTNRELIVHWCLESNYSEIHRVDVSLTNKLKFNKLFPLFDQYMLSASFYLYQIKIDIPLRFQPIHFKSLNVFQSTEDRNIECRTTIYSYGKRVLETSEIKSPNCSGPSSLSSSLPSSQQQQKHYFYTFDYSQQFFETFFNGVQCMDSEAEMVAAVEHISMIQVFIDLDAPIHPKTGHSPVILCNCYEFLNQRNGKLEVFELKDYGLMI